MTDENIYTTVTFKYSFESCIGNVDADRYVREVNMDIVGFNDIDGEFLIGKAKIVNLLLGLADEEDVAAHLGERRR